MDALEESDSPVPFWPGEPGEARLLALADGAKLHLEVFERQGTRTGRVLLFLHGIGAYAAPYRGLASAALSAVDAVAMPDLRGHGRSESPRGVMGRGSRILDDVEALVRQMRAWWPDSEMILGGESMGGLIALAYAASDREAVQRLLLLAPAVRLHANRGSLVKAVASGRGLGQGFRIHDAPRGETPHDPHFRARSTGDPLMLRAAGLDYFSTIAAWMAGWEVRYPRRVSVPCLIVQGTEDRVIEARGAEALAARLPDARLLLVPGAWHNLLWDETTQETIDAIVEWLMEGDPGG